MTREPPTFFCNNNDPAFVEKARVYVFDLYRFKRNERLNPEPLPEGAKVRHLLPIQIDGAKLPEEYMSRRQFFGLKEIHEMNEAFMATALTDEVDSADEAALRLAYSGSAEVINHFIFSLLAFLGLDRSFSPQNPWSDASVMLGWGKGELLQRYETCTRDYTAFAHICRVAHPIVWRNADLQESLAVLRETGQLFFMTVSAIFPIRSIAKCQIAFVRLMDALKSGDTVQEVENYIRRRKTMSRDIEKWRRHGGANTDAQTGHTLTREDIRLVVAQEVADIKADLAKNIAATEANTAATQANTSAVTNMDRRQKTMWTKILKVVEGFVALFKTPRAALTAEKVQNALMPPDRYTCLANIHEPHRSQVKVVIDYTLQYPIVLEKKHEDDFTLAKAVRAVWLKRAESWAKIIGTYATFEDLKSACYNLRGKPNDPFCYQR